MVIAAAKPGQAVKRGRRNRGKEQTTLRQPRRAETGRSLERFWSRSHGLGLPGRRGIHRRIHRLPVAAWSGKSVTPLMSGRINWSGRSAVIPASVAREQFNLRHLQPAEVPEPVDLAVFDLSFISLTLVLPAVMAVLDPDHGQLICLIKPQFELRREDVGAGGIVKDPELHEQAVERIRRFVQSRPGLHWRGLRAVSYQRNRWQYRVSRVGIETEADALIGAAPSARCHGAKVAAIL